MKKEYLTVNEFAEAVGISKQAVYKQLNNKLKPYLKVVENRKMLNKSALKLFSEKENSTNKVEQQLNNKLIEMLRTELDRKNEQIEKLQQALDQAQRLHAMDKQRILELECKEEPEEPKKKKWWQRK